MTATPRETAPARARLPHQLLRARDAALPERRAAHRPPEELLGRRRHRPLPPPARPRACCTRWATTPSACRPRTTRSRPACTRATRPPRRSPPSSASSARGASRSTGRASWPRTNRATTAGRSGSSSSCSAPAWPTARRRRSSGAPTTRPCSPTSRSTSTGTASAAARWSRSRQLEQWFLRITDYAERLLGDLDAIEWPEHVKTMQRNWIGRCEGAEVTFRCEELGIDYPVFTTRPDTLFGATFFVMAPEHPDVLRLAAGHRARAGGARVRQPRAQRDQRGARQRREAEDRRAARAHRHQPRQRRADPDVRRRLRADGVRHRRDHGGARRTTSATTRSRAPSACRSGA